MILKLLMVATISLISPDGVPVSELWGNLERGAYDVGFTSLFVYDKSRPTLSNLTGLVPESPKGRQMQINIWYPARESTKSRMTVADYAELLARQIEFEPSTSETRTK